MTWLWIVLGGFVLAGAYVAQLVRWLRVLQREHYEAASMGRFLRRWSAMTRWGRVRTLSLSGWLVVALGVAVLLGGPLHGGLLVVGVTTAYGLLAPRGLSIKGRTSRLAWTRRLRTIAITASGLSIVVAIVVGLVTQSLVGGVLVVWIVPFTLAASVRLLAPLERRDAARYVAQASARLARVSPRIIAITGSYGKTSTKNHVADLLRADGAVVATPKSFNNQAGLSRAINEGLADGTKLFIAEMGTYGPGEIAALCDWCQPDVAIITAIGPVHLERMGDLETIERAKFEITAHATTVILNVDDERLRGWIPRLDGRRVVTAGATSIDAMVRVVVGERWTILRDGAEIARIEPPAGLQPTNVACAVAAALEVGVAPDQIAARCHFSPVPNRLQSVVAPSGVTIVDDTFNANPASGASALAFFMSLPVTGRRVVVTPGLIELGDRQTLENSAFARAIEAAGCELVIVNRTNADALSAGHSAAHRVAHRDDAVAWVRSELVAGDGVLYVNDLPDQYP